MFTSLRVCLWVWITYASEWPLTSHSHHAPQPSLTIGTNCSRHHWNKQKSDLMRSTWLPLASSDGIHQYLSRFLADRNRTGTGGALIKTNMVLCARRLCKNWSHAHQVKSAVWLTTMAMWCCALRTGWLCLLHWLALHDGMSAGTIICSCAATCVCICVFINEDGLHTMVNDRQARELQMARRRGEWKNGS